MSHQRRIEISNIIKTGRSKASVAREFQVSRRTVYNDLLKVKKKEYFKKAYNSQSRFLINSQEESEIMYLLAFNKFTTLENIIKECNLSCSKPTLSKFLKKRGIKIFEALNRIKLTEKMKLERFKWCLEREKWVNEWKNVCYTSDITIQSFSNKNEKMSKRSKAMQEENTGTYRLNIWGYISYSKFEIFRVSSPFNRYSFENVLQRKGALESIRNTRTTPYPIKAFQQDNLRTRFVNEITELIKKAELIILNVPRYSDDLAPIVNILNIFKKRVEEVMAKVKINSEDHLWAVCLDVKNNISIDLVRSEIDSMPERCSEIIKNYRTSLTMNDYSQNIESKVSAPAESISEMQTNSDSEVQTNSDSETQTNSDSEIQTISGSIVEDKSLPALDLTFPDKPDLTIFQSFI